MTEPKYTHEPRPAPSVGKQEEEEVNKGPQLCVYGMDHATGQDRTVVSLHLGRRCEIVPWPEGFPADGHGISTTAFRDTLICAHPDAPPHMLNLETGKWEKLK